MVRAPTDSTLIIFRVFMAITDTIYGSQDKKDDVSAGVKSIVLLLQQHTKIALSIFAAGLWLSWTICGFMTSSGPVYFVITTGGGGLLLARDLWTVDVDDPKSCLIAVSSLVVNLIVSSS